MIVLAQPSTSLDPASWAHVVGLVAVTLIMGAVLVVALRICLRDVPAEHRPEVIRALADLLRGWFPRGGPPPGGPL